MILRRLRAAWAGRRMWLRLKKKYDVDNGAYVLLMPENDQELNEQALAHLGDFVRYRRAEGIIILTNNHWVMENARFYSDKIIEVLACPEKSIDALLTFCEFYRFTERLLVVSLTKPYGNKAWCSVGIHNVSVEDLVCLGIYCIRSWTKEGNETWITAKENSSEKESTA